MVRPEEFSNRRAPHIGSYVSDLRIWRNHKVLLEMGKGIRLEASENTFLTSIDQFPSDRRHFLRKWRHVHGFVSKCN